MDGRRGQTHSDPAGEGIEEVKRREMSTKESVITSVVTYAATQNPWRGIIKA